MSSPVVIGGDCLKVLRDMESESVHAIVTDPPYGLSQVDAVKLTTALTAWVNGDRESVPGGKGFMGKEWDAFVPPPAVWDECLRVLKPGGHMLVFAGSRTVDLMGLSIRLAGFEIRDTLQWLYGSGFPKSLDVSKALDKIAGAEREVIGPPPYTRGRASHSYSDSRRVSYDYDPQPITAPATDAAREWEGWGTALKPAAEPIILARKPLESTVARNVLAHGVGGLNIDGCRVGSETRTNPAGGVSSLQRFSRVDQGYRDTVTTSVGSESTVTGRFPANVLLTHNPDCTDDACDLWCPVAELDAQTPNLHTQDPRTRKGSVGQSFAFGTRTPSENYADSGGASRFFPSFRYQAKAPTSERPKVDGVAHPTVKPVALMRWLVRLITPPGGTVLDPFAGSGTTLQAASEEGFASIGIERELDYVKLIEARLGMDNAA